MCFSATASFAASGLLTVVGAATMKTAKNNSMKPYAAIPLVFAIQQAIEGFVWISVSGGDPELLQSMTYGFVFIAQVFWPFFVPLSVFLMEKDPKRKKILVFLLLIGTVISTYLLYCLINYPVSAEITGFHVLYKLDYPPFQLNYNGILYIMATVLPSFFSSYRKMPLFGIAIAVSLLVSRIFYPEHLVSVWCYFAAILSAVIYFVVRAANLPHLRGDREG
jgi:hypothetical protein